MKRLESTTTRELGCKGKLKKGLSTYLVTDLRTGLQGLGGAFFILLCDPRCPPDRCSIQGALVSSMPGGACSPPASPATEPSLPLVNNNRLLPLPLLRLCGLGRGLGGGYLPRCLSRTPRNGDLGWRPKRHGGSLVVTPNRRVGDLLVDGGNRHYLHVRHITDLVAVLVLVP
jgi:hypothetical protein